MKDQDLATPARHPVSPTSASVLRKPGVLVAAVITAAAMLLSAAVAAQDVTDKDVTYTSETTIEFAGALGTLMSFVPGGDETTTETVSIKDSKVRTDTEEASWVMDYATGTMLFEDHEKRTLLGDMVMITDQWSSEEFPAAQAMKRMQEEYADEMAAMGSRAGETGSGIAAAFQYDGRFRAAVERNKEELEQLDGIPVKSTMYFVLVPPEAELDRDAVLALNGNPISEGLGSQMADMAAESAAESAKDAVESRLGGLFDGGDDDDDDNKEEVPAPTPSVLLRATVTVTDVEETILDAAIFGPRTGYAEEMPEQLRRMVGGES